MCVGGGVLKKLAFILLLASPSWGSYCGSYTYQRMITISSANVSNVYGTVNNFPVLVQSSDVKLSTTSGTGHLANTNGFDLIFSTDSACAYQMNWDTVTINNTGSGVLNVFVNVPQLTTATLISATFYMTYGNSGITTYQGHSTGTWDTNYVGVWHMNELSGNAKDATTNGYVGTNSNITYAQTGKFGKAYQFNGSSSLSQMASFTNVYNPTIEGWINLNNVGGTTAVMQANSFDGNLLWYGWSSTRLSFYNSGGIEWAWNYTVDSSWHHIVFDPANSMIYWDGSPVSLIQLGGSNSWTYYTTTNFQFGGGYNGYVNAYMQEMRISNAARNADWVKTSYNSQSAPGTFVTIGSEQGGAGGAASNPFFFGEF